MTNMRRFPEYEDLFRRETIEIELPRFLVRIFESEVARANLGAPNDERLTLNHYLEYHLAEFVSLSDVLELEKGGSGNREGGLELAGGEQQLLSSAARIARAQSF